MSYRTYWNTINWAYSQIPDKKFDGTERTQTECDDDVANLLLMYKHFDALEDHLGRVR